jgi:hypothetical protein
VKQEEMIALNKPEQIEAFALLSLRGRLMLETIGLKARGQSALQIIKSKTGLSARTAKAMQPKFNAWLIERGVLKEGACQT